MTTDTPMPVPCRSARNPPAKPRSPNLVAEYRDAPFVPTWPDRDDSRRNGPTPRPEPREQGPGHGEWECPG